MNDETERPVPTDALVSTALQMLPVPDHDPAFWTRLGSALDVESGQVAAAAEAPPVTSVFADTSAPGAGPGSSDRPTNVVELVPQPGVVPRSLRRGSNVVLSAVAVAAAVMVVVAGVSLVRDDSGSGGGTDLAATPTSADSNADRITDTTGSTEGSMAPITGLTAPTGEPEAAVMAWIAALSAGDMKAAWAGLTTSSQDDWGSESKFADQRTGFAEGYGAWSHVEPDAVYVTPITSSDEGSVVVVTLVGTVEQEGTSQRRADAFAVRVVEGRALLDMDPFSGELEVVVPEPVPAGGKRPVVDSDGSLVVVVPAGVEAPVIRLDDGEALACGDAPGTELAPLSEGAAQRCEYTPRGGIPAGDRVLTVAFVSPDGSDVSAQSVLFEAA